MIEVCDLRFAWNKRYDDILRIKQFTVGKGERVFLQGSSGSGKTTLLSLLGGVVVPDSGRIVIDDIELSGIRSAGRDQFRVDHLGFIFQMFNLIPYLSPVQNVLLPCKFSKAREARASTEHSATIEAVRLLSQLGLEGKIVRQPSSVLSVGQQQRVAAARALIGSPGLIIADEPTSALDADARVNFLHLLFEECDRTGATVLFVSHDSALGEQFDRTVNLADINQAVEMA